MQHGSMISFIMDAGLLVSALRVCYQFSSSVSFAWRLLVLHCMCSSLKQCSHVCL